MWFLPFTSQNCYLPTYLHTPAWGYRRPLTLELHRQYGSLASSVCNVTLKTLKPSACAYIYGKIHFPASLLNTVKRHSSVSRTVSQG